LALARNGFYTYSTIRNLKKSTSIKKIATKEALLLKVIQLDVNDYLLAKNTIQEIIFENEPFTVYEYIDA
jgi:hypothetical protein